MEKPILFSTEMVRAILDGRKTMTRRVIKPAKRNHRGFKQGDGLWIDGYGAEDKPNGHIKDYSVSSVWQRKDYYIKDFAPYKPGDVLWVRETWAAQCDDCEDNQGSGYDDATCAHGDCNCYVYRADNNLYPGGMPPGGKWRPSIHMPREAARIFLRVINVRIERLQEITGQDVLKEGLNSHVHPQAFYFDCNQREMFENLWNSTIKKSDLDRYGWDANPWVWVVSFKRLD